MKGQNSPERSKGSNLNDKEFRLKMLCHDLKSPINQLKGLLSILENQVEDNPEAMKVLKMAISSNQTLLDTVQLHLEESSEDKSRIEILDFEAMIKEIENGFHDSSQYKLKLITNINSDLRYFGNYTVLYSVFQNLIENAIKYRCPSKEECIIIFSIQQSANHLIIKVTDNGQGIPEDKLAFIFNKNYRVSDLSEGTGMGLYLVKRSLSDLNGQIEVKSELGEGTTFTMQLPKPALTVA